MQSGINANDESHPSCSSTKLTYRVWRGSTRICHRLSVESHHSQGELEGTGKLMLLISVSLSGQMSASRLTLFFETLRDLLVYEVGPPRRVHVACNLGGSGPYSTAGYFRTYHSFCVPTSAVSDNLRSMA